MIQRSIAQFVLVIALFKTITTNDSAVVVVALPQSNHSNNNDSSTKYTFRQQTSRYRRRRSRPGRLHGGQKSSSSSMSTIPTIANMTCSYITQPLNHFDLPRNSSGTYQQRFCYYNGFVIEKQQHKNEYDNNNRSQKVAPVFLYIGNESPIETYINHTGFMWEYGREIHAQIIFLEHRYEGLSLPMIPAMSSSRNCMAYSSSIQAIADAAHFIRNNNVMQRYESSSTATTITASTQSILPPIIVFGGSYGGMLAAWLRILYPSVVVGAIAASAPIYGLPIPMTSYEETSNNKVMDPTTNQTTTTTTTVIDSASQIISYGLQQPYPPTNNIIERNNNMIDEEKNNNTAIVNNCSNNLLSVFPLITILSQHEIGRQLLQDSFRLCYPFSTRNITTIATTLIDWIQSPWFDLAEGSYPYPSSYISYALTHNEHVQLPSWPLQSACWVNSTLYKDLGITIQGDISNVTYSISYGDSNLTLHVDWDTVTAQLSAKSLDDALLEIVQEQSINDEKNTILSLLTNVRDAVSVWYNASLDVQCFDIDFKAPNTVDRYTVHDHDVYERKYDSNTNVMTTTYRMLGHDDDSNHENTTKVCYEKMKREGSWPSLYCNEEMNLIITYASGMGNDCFWPPTVPRHVRTYSQMLNVTPSIIDVETPCHDPFGIYGYPQQKRDVWSTWYDTVYGGRNIGQYTSNIIFTNGRLDPWSAAGVVPNLHPRSTTKIRGINGNVVNNSSYGTIPGLNIQYLNPTVVSLMMDYGGHHTDLMYSNPLSDPPCVQYTRLFERETIAEWIQKFWKTVL